VRQIQILECRNQLRFISTLHIYLITCLVLGCATEWYRISFN